MNNGPDKKRLRRAYLLKKGKAYVVTACFAAFLLVMCAGLIRNPLTQHRPNWLIVTWFAITGTGMFLMARDFLKGIRRAHEQARQAYVPPIAPSTLPAKEGLVRIAEESSPPQDTLLRATAQDDATKGEELLQRSQGG